MSRNAPIEVVCKLQRHLYILCRRLETPWYSSPKYNFLNVHVDAIFWGICIQWTGVLDWSAGMEYWNGITGMG